MAELFGYRYQLSIGNKSEYLNISLNPGNSTIDKDTRAKLLSRSSDVGYLRSALTSGLRISFMVQQEFGGFVSYAEISVYNLTTENEEKIFEKYRLVTLQAGFPELFGTIFKGQIINYQRIAGTNEGTHGIKLFCRSSAESLDFSHINRTFAPEAEIVEVIRTVAAAIGNPVVFYGEFSALPKRSRGTVLKGSPNKLLDKMAGWFDFSWAIENGVTKIIKKGAKADGDMFVFSAQTGMIGSPVVGDGEVNVRVALNPAVKLASNVQIKSLAPEFAFSGAYFVDIPRSIGEGVFQVRRINHVGDSFSAVWETQLTCFRLADVQRNSIAERSTR